MRMRMPIKLNKQGWPRFVTDWLPSVDNPNCLINEDIQDEEFIAAASVFKFGETFKTTDNIRYPITLDALARINYAFPPVVLDIGASIGITSLNLIARLDFQRYYITDLHLDICYERSHGRFYYYDADWNCILIATKRFLFYPDTKDAVFPFSWIARKKFSKVLPSTKNLPKVILVHPALKDAEGDIVIKKYDVLTKWPGEKADLIIAANILSNDHFSDQNIRTAVRNIFSALKKPGRFVVVNNKSVEKSTIFYVREGEISVEMDINGGAEARSLILQSF
jgi:hypothetical protein